jgi:sorbitol-6-phosphate 2-dehydrogenase
MELKGQVAVVTGAGQGLGEAIAYRLLREGAKVVFADVNFNRLTLVLEKYDLAFQNSIHIAQVDVTDEQSVQHLMETTFSTFGKIDLLVSNAGILIAGETPTFDASDWRKVIEVNLVGYFLCAKHVSKYMLERKKGNIIQINSKSGKVGSFKNTAYAASKFGGIGLTQSLALEFAPHGIRVNAICPGNLLDSPLWVDSLYDQYAEKWGISKEEVRKKYEEQVPMGRGCSYEDVANLVVFLASDRSSYITGLAINVTGGQVMW